MTPSPGSARSLAEWLRQLPDDCLAALLRARPDLLVPAPVDTASLALRLGDRVHVSRILDELDAFSLSVLDALMLLHDADAAEAAVGAPIEPTLHRLEALGLVWRDPAPRLVGGVAAAIERPGGLGRPWATLLRRVDRAHLAAVLGLHGVTASGDVDQSARRLLDELPAALAALDADERAVLERVDAAGGLGSLARAGAAPDAEDASPARRLVARGLLVPVDSGTVELPREVGRALREATWLQAAPPEPPALAAAGAGRADADAAGALAAAEFVRLTDGLLGLWAADPPAELRAGGLSLRDLRQAAKVLAVEEATVVLLAETARAAGLVGRTTSFDARFAPTVAYDTWRRRSTAQRWAALAAAWLAAPVDATALARRDDRSRAPLAGQNASPLAREARGLVLTGLAAAAPGTGPTRTSLVAYLAWLRPRRTSLLADTRIDAVLVEARALGVVVGDAITVPGRRLLEENEDATATALSAALPPPVDHLLLQADLTAIAPGLLADDLADEVALLADVESPGSATVYRFTESSLRRAFDAGQDAAGVLDFLERTGRPAVPQTLRYLVEDTGRRFGRIRVGAARAYVRTDDHALMAEVLADRACAGLGLRLLAPGVALCAADPGQVLETLRAAGYAPAAESSEGVLALGRAEGTRAPRGMALPVGHPGARTDPARVVARLRAGDRAADARPTQPSGLSNTLALLERAVEENRPVVLGYVNAQGVDSRRIVDPERVASGLLTAYDHRTQERRSFALSRITSLALADEGGA